MNPDLSHIVPLIQKNDVEGMAGLIGNRADLQIIEENADELLWLAMRQNTFCNENDCRMATLLLPYEKDCSGLVRYSLDCGNIEFAGLVASDEHYVPENQDVTKAIEASEPGLAKTILKRANANNPKLNPQAIFDDALAKGDGFRATFMLDYGVKLETIKTGRLCAECGYQKLLETWIERYREDPEYASEWRGMIKIVAGHKSKWMTSLMLEHLPHGDKPFFFNPVLSELLLSKDGEDAALPYLASGKLGATESPADNIGAIKCLALGKRYSPKNIELFDGLVAQLKQACEPYLASVGRASPAGGKEGNLAGAYRKLDKRLNEYVYDFADISENDLLQNNYKSKQFFAFAKVFGTLYQLAQSLDPQPPGTLSPLFTNLMLNTEGNSLSLYQNMRLKTTDVPSECRNVGDCVDYLVKILLIPELIRKVERKRGEWQDVDYEQAAALLRPQMARVWVGDRGAQAIVKLAKEWHRMLRHFEKMRLVDEDTKWPALTADYTAPNGYMITFLTDGEQLREEGDDMVHCSGTKVVDCSGGYTHVASIRRKGKDAFAFQLRKLRHRIERNDAYKPHQATAYEAIGKLIPDYTGTESPFKNENIVKSLLEIFGDEPDPFAAFLAKAKENLIDANHPFQMEESKGEPVATVVLNWRPGMPCPVELAKVIQDNTPIEPGTPASMALQSFLRAFKNKAVTVNRYELETRHEAMMKRRRVMSAEYLKEWIGFNPLSEWPEFKRVVVWGRQDETTPVDDQGMPVRDKTYENVEAGYFDELLKVHESGKPLIPGGWRTWGNTEPDPDRPNRNAKLHHFLKETGLMEVIKEIAADPPLIGAAPKPGVEVKDLGEQGRFGPPGPGAGAGASA